MFLSQLKYTEPSPLKRSVGLDMKTTLFPQVVSRISLYMVHVLLKKKEPCIITLPSLRLGMFTWYGSREREKKNCEYVYKRGALFLTCKSLIYAPN